MIWKNGEFRWKNKFLILFQCLVEAGMIVYEPLQSIHTALQIDRGIESIDVRRRKHDLLFSTELQLSHDPDKLQRVLEDMRMFPDGLLTFARAASPLCRFWRRLL